MNPYNTTPTEPFHPRAYKAKSLRYHYLSALKVITAFVLKRFVARMSIHLRIAIERILMLIDDRKQNRNI
ncbi:hypothetical protein [Bartonella quintana]|uniref:hypothetical protein n=1 Tax=Bartonella quintana TaxID=803 RepID=UPI00027FC9D4|nr:hypothetical protein [Bartonella quintana]AFR26270.1 hypothetical protein RM11_0537 [Bartonella quintana RM-11]